MVDPLLKVVVVTLSQEARSGTGIFFIKKKKIGYSYIIKISSKDKELEIR